MDRFKIGDYVLLWNPNGTSEHHLGIVRRFGITRTKTMAVYVPALRKEVCDVPTTDPEHVLPLRFEGIRGRHCDVYHIDKSSSVFYWDGDEIVSDADKCDRVSFDASKIDRKSTNLRSLIARLTTMQLHDRLRELRIPVQNEQGHMMSRAEMLDAYRDSMLRDLQLSLQRCTQLVEAAGDACMVLEAKCKRYVRPWKRNECMKQVSECKLDAKLPPSVLPLKSKLEEAEKCHSRVAKKRGVVANDMLDGECVALEQLREDVNFFNTACTAMKLVDQKYRPVKKTS